jgi:integrase/recombinase XerC/integrase/recombinase XerD
MKTALQTRNNTEIQALPAHRTDELLERFLASQDVKKSSKDLYRRTLRQYFKWVTLKGYYLSEITRAELLIYKEELLASGKSSLTVGSYITSVRRFYEWTEANKFYPNVAKGIKSPKRKQQFKKQSLTPEQSRELLIFLEGKALRDYAVVNLLLRTGLRTIEARRANVEDIAFKSDKRVLYIHGKGRDEKDDFVILTDKAFAPLARYIETRGKLKSRGEPLFISTSNNSSGDRLTTRTISSIAKEGLKAIGLDGRNFTAHSLRHTTAVNILRAGGSMEDAQGVLRHANPATTQIYTATIKEEQGIKNAPEELLDSLY